MVDTKIKKQISLTEKFHREMEANKNEIEEIKEQIKGMENIVGRNMASMEHQLKSASLDSPSSRSCAGVTSTNRRVINNI